MPLNEPNFDAGYILDYGDALKIQLIGQKNFEDIYKYQEADQSIFLRLEL